MTRPRRKGEFKRMKKKRQHWGNGGTNKLSVERTLNNQALWPGVFFSLFKNIVER